MRGQGVSRGQFPALDPDAESSAIRQLVSEDPIDRCAFVCAHGHDWARPGMQAVK